MGQIVTISLILFFIMIALGYGTNNCSTFLNQYASQDYSGLSGAKNIITLMINTISNNLGTFLGTIGGGIILSSLLGINFTWAIGLFVFQVIANIFLIPIDCIKASIVIEPLATIIIIFFNLSLLYLIFSIISQREV